MTENEKFELDLKYLIGSELYDQARRFDDSIKEIKFLSSSIFDDLIKTLLIKDINYSYYLKELNGGLKECQFFGDINLKSRNRLTIQEYYECLFSFDKEGEDNEDNFKNYILSTIKEYYDLRNLQDEKLLEYRNLDFKELYNKFKNIYKNISEDLSNNNFEDIRDYIELGE